MDAAHHRLRTLAGHLGAAADQAAAPPVAPGAASSSYER